MISRLVPYVFLGVLMIYGGGKVYAFLFQDRLSVAGVSGVAVPVLGAWKSDAPDADLWLDLKLKGDSR